MTFECMESILKNVSLKIGSKQIFEKRPFSSLFLIKLKVFGFVSEKVWENKERRMPMRKHHSKGQKCFLRSYCSLIGGYIGIEKRS